MDNRVIVFRYPESRGFQALDEVVQEAYFRQELLVQGQNPEGTSHFLGGKLCL